LSNLLTNALTHGAEDGPVRIKASEGGDGLQLSVCNDGTPISAEVLETLFQPFTRDNVRASQHGFGLGLYISAEIAKAHGGTRKASSG
jgi:sigma-B regulation protein RsbU (phosphoserine phosphatase)